MTPTIKEVMSRYEPNEDDKNYYHYSGVEQMMQEWSSIQNKVKDERIRELEKDRDWFMSAHHELLKDSQRIAELEKDNERIKLERNKFEGGDELKSKKIAELEAWKESVIEIIPPMQELGEAMGLQFGESIHDKVLPYIKSLQKDKEIIEELKDHAETWERTAMSYRNVAEELAKSNEAVVFNFKRVAELEKEKKDLLLLSQNYAELITRQEAENKKLREGLEAAKLALKEIYTGTDFPLSVAQNSLRIIEQPLSETKPNSDKNESQLK
jgi:hypothetical protein